MGQRMVMYRLVLGTGLVFLLLTATGCPPAAGPMRFEPISMRQAVRIVNDNTARIGGTLQASGSVDGYFTSDGRQQRYHVDAVLFYLSPCYLRFDLKKFGDRQVLFGSNDADYWCYLKEDDAYYCGRHDAPEELPPDIPVRPDQIGDALGLSLVRGLDEAASHTRMVQRVVDDYQQILFLVHDARGRLILEKEYWLDRYSPQLVRRVVFRDGYGALEMESRLDEYGPLEPGGPLLPRAMIADWPKSQTRMRFRIDRWTLVDQVTPSSIQFATPRECTEP